MALSEWFAAVLTVNKNMLDVDIELNKIPNANIPNIPKLMI